MKQNENMEMRDYDRQNEARESDSTLQERAQA